MANATSRAAAAQRPTIVLAPRRVPPACGGWRARPVAQSGVGARRRSEWTWAEQVEEEPASVEHVVEEADASSAGLFNSNFKSVLADALSRQGKESLVQGAERDVDENRISDQEEVLKAAIISSKTTLMKMQTARAELEKAIEAETRQVERLMFALHKARNDAAYYRGLATMMDEGASSD